MASTMAVNETAVNETCLLNGTLVSDNSTLTNICSSSFVYNPPQPSAVSEEVKVFLIFLYVVIFLLGTLGNSIVCYCIGKKRHLSGGDVFVLSLAAADILASVFVPVLFMHDLIANMVWHLGVAMCKVLPSIPIISLAASSWSLVLIAADRFKVILHPMKPPLTTKLKIIGVAFIWVLAAGLSVPYFTLQKLTKERICSEDPTLFTKLQKTLYIMTLMLIGWIIPMVLVTVLYSICIFKLRKSRFDHAANKSMRKRVIQNKKVIKTFIMVSGFFCLCTMPYSVFYIASNLLLSFGQNVDMNILLAVNYPFFALMTANSCINPFIYSKRQPEVKAFVQAVYNRIHCKTATLRRSSRQMTYEVTMQPEVETRRIHTIS